MDETLTLAEQTADTEVADTSAPVAAEAVAVLVLGMHRSGTSALAGVLHGLGIEFGRTLMPATTDNPRGYFEHLQLYAVHEAVLGALGSRWDDIRPLQAGWESGPVAEAARHALRAVIRQDFAAARLWAVKDPRLCRLVPLWRPVLAEFSVTPRYLLMLRRADEVAASLAARDGMSRATARLLWLRHILEAEAASRDFPRAIVHYHELVEEPARGAALLARIARTLDIALPASPATAAQAIETMVAPELRHHRIAAATPGAGWIEAVEHAFAAGDGPKLRAVCDRVRREMLRADAVLGTVLAERVAAPPQAAPNVARAPAAPVTAPAPKPPETATEPDYAKWRAARAFTAVAHSGWVAERIASWGEGPRFAFGMVVPAGTENRIAQTLESLRRQALGDWQLHAVIAGAPPAGFEEERRLFWHRADGRPIAALNRALGEAAADWIALIDGGDEVAPHALVTIRLAIETHGEWRAFYTDEDRIDPAGTHSGAHFKPDFNLDLMRGMPYVGGLLAVRREVFATLEGLTTRWDGLEECDLALRLAELIEPGHFGHIADILYHRFTQSGRTRRPPAEICADLPALVQAHLDRLGIKASAETGPRPLFCRVRYHHDGPEPLVSIVIPTRNQLSFLKRCVETVLDLTRYQNYEVIIVDNGSSEGDAVEYLRLIEDKVEEIGSRLRVLRHPGPFNFSAMNNRAVREAARGNYICLLNNDTAPLDGDWLDELMRHARRPEVGVVGAKLTYPDGRIQHGGVILGINWGMPADHPYNGAPGDAMGYWGRLLVHQDLSAVTAACLITRRAIFDEVRGLDEAALAVSYNDVDYCLKVREAGYLVVWTPDARLLHEGSVSQRGEVEAKSDQAKQARFAKEKATMYARWLPAIARDPAYNPNLTLTQLGFTAETESAPTWNPDFRPRPRVLVHPADREGCGEYRMIAPARALFRDGVLHSFETMRLMTPPELARIAPDSVIFQRQLELRQIENIRTVKSLSKAFRVFEIDDLITNLPLKSAYRPAIADDIGQRLKSALALCDRLVVSTEPLAQRYGKLCDEVRVVPNRLEQARWLGLKPKHRPEGKPRVGWAGAIGHLGDLALITSVLEATHRAVDWVFFGMCPDALRPYVAEFHEWVPLDRYPEKLAALDLDLAVAPLEFNPFNEAKSNLRLLEYGVLGYPVICTDIVPYQCDLPVTRLKNRHRDWIKAILDMVADRDACRRQGAALRAAVVKDWMLEDHLEDWRAAWMR
ncbi:MAG: glycosyltransferase [Stellaceae bacterium]